MNRMIAISATFFALVCAPAALAGDNTWRVGNHSFTVKFDDLDVQTPGGRSTALARVEKAAAKLCGNAPRRVRDACRLDVVKAAAQDPSAVALRTALAEQAQRRAWAMAAAR